MLLKKKDNKPNPAKIPTKRARGYNSSDAVVGINNIEAKPHEATDEILGIYNFYQEH